MRDFLGVARGLEFHMTHLSREGIQYGLDGVVCSAHEIKAIRQVIGHEGLIVTPGIRPAQGEVHDQKRVGDAPSALADGADYLVIGRALAEHVHPEEALAALGFAQAPA